MKAKRPDIERALRGPPAYRFLLLHGPDEAGSQALVRLAAAAAGEGAERVELTGAELRADPARLADESASLSLFGGARYVVVEPAGDECVAAVEALLEAHAAGNAVILVAGALKPASRLLKLALAEPAALAFASYPPEGPEAERLVADMARAEGLNVPRDVARRLADACAGNRAILALELQKLALYLDSAPERPRPVDHDALDAVGAAAEEGNLSRLVDSVGNGNAPLLQAELLRLSGEGIEGIALIRAVLRRMSLLARLRAQVERGNSPDSVMASHGKSLFWKEKDSIGRQLSRWRSEPLARSVSRLLEAERQVKASGGLGPRAVDEELFAICRQAARLR
ncbi:MAG TPA: DNA polymerase III subunit delta [Allosphingosinicella sp.]|nr:DNA polymerase III subunit delta [Allosphingosinicella sp.]